MEKIVYFGNFNFDQWLLNGNQHLGQNIVEELEYLVSYCEPGCILYSLKDYSPEFKEKFLSITGSAFQTTNKKKEAIAWFGDTQNIMKAKVLNSKVTAYNISKKLGIELNKSQIIEQQTLMQCLEDGEFLIKPEFGFSGKGIRKVNKDIKLDSSLKYILEPKLTRVRDFSIWIKPLSKEYIYKVYENIVDKKFHYSGTVFKTSKINIDEKLILKIVEEYKLLGAESDFVIDCFIYHENGEERIRYLSEVNYRKTLGMVFHWMNDQLFEGRMEKVLLGPSDKGSGLLVSPKNNKLKITFV